MQPIKRPSIRRSSQNQPKSQHPIEIQPDYTEDEEDNLNNNFKVAFSYYPSGSMTLPHPHKKSSQKGAENPAEKKDQVKKGAETAAAQATEQSSNVVSPANSPKKSLNESGESDPGYESDSSKSKSNSGGQSQSGPAPALLMTEPKATTLPRRSATVQKNSALQHTLDRRKLRVEEEAEELLLPSSSSKTGTESEAGLTVEIISPVRVPITIPLLFHIGLVGPCTVLENHS